MTDGPRDDGPRDADHAASSQMLWHAKARLWIAIVLLLGALVVIWISFLTSHLHSCDDQVARVGSTALVQSCRPLSITDAPVLAMLIAAALLLFSVLPDLSALEIFGLFRLERQLKEQAKDQAKRHEDTIAAIHRLEVSQKVSQATNNYFIAEKSAEETAKILRLAAGVEEKREQL